MPRLLPPPIAAGLWRPVAFLGAALVMLLGMASVSPELHAWLHDGAQPQAHACPHHGHHAPVAHDSQDDQPAGDLHGCAVTLFSHGVVQQAVALATPPCEGILRAINHRAFERLALAQPRFLHLPPQAPPAV